MDLTSVYERNRLEELTAPPLVTQIQDAMKAAGIHPAPNDFILDGTIHRFPTGKDRTTGPNSGAGFYVLRQYGPVTVGTFGDWRNPDGWIHKFHSNPGRALTSMERLQIEQEQRLMEERLMQEREKEQREARERAIKEWKAATAAHTHAYLTKKGVQPWGTRVDCCSYLLVPVFVQGELSSLQHIDREGNKRFMSGGATKGGYYFLDTTQDGPVYICEGFATAASVREALDSATVVCAFNAGNLESVGRYIRSREEFIGRPLVYVADNDENGVGQKAAQKAAEATRGKVIIPPQIGDANDYAQAGGDLRALLLEGRKKQWLIHESEFTAAPAPLRWLIKYHIQRGALHMIFGPSGAGKTFLVLDWIMRIAAGMETWQHYKVRSGPVVYLAGEGHQGLRARIEAWKRHHEVFEEIPMWISRSGVDLDKVEGLSEVIEEIDSIGVKPACVVVDTLHRFLSGDENKAQDTRAMLKSCAVLQERYGAAVILVHHTGISLDAKGRARGSSSWKGALEMEFSVEKKPRDKADFYGTDPERLILKNTKSKDGQPLAERELVISPYTLTDWTDEDGVPTKTAVLMTEGEWQERHKETPPEPVAAQHVTEQGETEPCVDFDRVEEIALKALQSAALGTENGVTQKEWSKVFYSMAEVGDITPTWRKRFQRARESLMTNGKVIYDGENYFSSIMW